MNAIIVDLGDKATRDELAALKDHIDPLISDFKVEVDHFKYKIQKNDLVLERFDEILLEKAAKDDIREIRGLLELLARKDDFIETSEIQHKDIDVLKSQIKQLFTKTEETKELFSAMAYKLDIIKRENHDVTQISYKLQNFKEIIETKADKSEIFGIYDLMGRQDDVTNLEIQTSKIKRQLELNCVMMHSMCRTLLKSGEPPPVIRKQRFDLFKNIGVLVNWVNGEGGSPRNFATSSRLGETQGRFEMNQTAYEMYSPPPSVRISKHKRVSTSVSPVKAHNSDLPPLKQY